MIDGAEQRDSLDPSSIHSTAEFGAALTELRDRAGLSVRQVAQAVKVPRTTVGDYFAGRSLPSAAMSWVLPEILVRCGVVDSDLVDKWQETLIRVRRAPGPARADSPVPYRGLQAFQPEDREWFHGRDKLVAALTEIVTTQGESSGPLFVIGPSGAGKSSLLRAGLIPALTSAEPNIDDRRWHWRLLTPAMLFADPAQARCAVEQLVDPSAGICGRLLIVVDQFEELFTGSIPDTERTAFIEALCSLVTPGSPVVVVLGMRSDFYDQAVRYPLLATALQRPTVVVGPMSEEELRAAIVRPAQQAGVELEDGLVELLLRDMHPHGQDGRQWQDGGALPLLSHVLLATWQAGNRRRLAAAGYLATGGLAHAVGQSADAVYLGLSPAQQRLARSLFLRLVQVGEDSADTRRSVARHELTHDPGMAAVLDQFVAQRLITVDAAAVQMSHEALVHAWPRLREWLDTDRDGLRLRRRLHAAATAWVDAGRDPGGLYRGAVLDAATTWAGNVGDSELTAMEREFLTASVTERTRQERDRRQQVRRLHRWVAALVVMVLVAAGLTTVVFKLRADAVHDRNLAVSRQAALQATTLRRSDPALAAQLALAAYRIAPTPEARSALLEAGVGPMVSRVRGSDGTIATGLSPDGRLMATGSANGTTRLWHVIDRRRLTPIGNDFPGAPGSIFAAAINPSGRLLALTGIGGALRIWDIADPTHPEPLPEPPRGLTGTGYAAAFSSDGHYLAAAGQGGIRVWALDPTGTPGALVLSADLAGDAKALAFSPDNRLLAAGGLGRQIQLWSLDGSIPASPGPPITGLPGVVNSLAFSPDGTTLAVGSGDMAVYLWDITHPDHPARTGQPLTGFTGPVYAVTYSLDGAELAAGSADSTVHIWDLVTHRERPVLHNPGPVTATTYLPRSHALLTAVADGHARLWDLPGGMITDAPGPISTVAFKPDGHAIAVSSSTGGAGGAEGNVAWSDLTDPDHPTPTGHPVTPPAGASRFTGATALTPDGTLLAAGSSDGTSRLWNVSNPDHPTPVGPTLTGPTAAIESLVFSPDTHTLAVGSDDHRVYLWDISTPATPRLQATLTDATNIVLTIAFSPDGHTLAAASVDYNAYLWDITNPTQPHHLHTITGHTNYAYAVAFSPDSHTLAIGSADKTVSLWNVTDTTNPQRIGQPLHGPTNYVFALTFTPDHPLLIAVSTDATVWIWDLTTLNKPNPYATLHTTSPAYAIALSPDHTTLATGTADKTTYLWTLNTDTLATKICTTAGDIITPNEWNQYIPDLPYTPPCTPNN
jgi:WD40 repeat protein